MRDPPYLFHGAECAEPRVVHYDVDAAEYPQCVLGRLPQDLWACGDVKLQGLAHW